MALCSASGCGGGWQGVWLWGVRPQLGGEGSAWPELGLWPGCLQQRISLQQQLCSSSAQLTSPCSQQKQVALSGLLPLP